MEYKYLQSFLDARLFSIAEENSNYEFLTATIPLFEKAVAKNNKNIISATLVALDPNIPQDEPVLDEVEGLLKKKWPLVRNKYTDRPTTMLRAIILESLFNLMQKNKVVANIVWLTGSNFLPFTNACNETPILVQWLKDAGDMAESNAITEWGLITKVKNIDIPQFSLGKITLPNVKIGKDPLSQGLYAALLNGKQIATGEAYGTTVTLRKEWAMDFATIATEHFITAFSKAIDNITVGVSGINIDKPINDFFSVFRNDLTKTLADSLKANEKLQLRSNILWWKESLYSNSAKKSYRDMEAGQAALTMAIDLADDVPAVYPVSIDFILKETILSCLGKDEPDKTVSEMLEQVALALGNLDNFAAFPEHGRVSFGTFVVGLVSGKTTAGELLLRTGISPESKISYGLLATLLLHDIQALKINIK